MGLFDGIGKAKMGGSQVYFLAGRYRVRVEKVFAFQSRKKEDFFIIEGTVLESNLKSRPKGTVASHLINLKHDAALGNIKQFIAAAMDLTEEEADDQVDEDVVELVISDDNPLGGTELGLVCTDITTRQGNPFTLHRWMSLETFEGVDHKSDDD